MRKPLILSLLLGTVAIAPQEAPSPAYRTVEDEGIDLKRRRHLNFTGSGVVCTDNVAADQTDCDFSGSVGSFPILAPNGSVGAPSYSFTNCTTCGLWLDPTLDGFNLTGGTSADPTGSLVRGTGASDSGEAGGSLTIAGGPAKFTGGGNGGDLFLQGGGAPSGIQGLVRISGWETHSEGYRALTSDHTNATATFSNISTLSASVTTGRRYTFTIQLFASESTAADGAKLDFNGGSAGTTNFIASCILFDATGAALAQSNATTAALSTVINIAAFTDTAVHNYRCTGTFEPSSTGTFIMRAAQNSHSSGTLTILRGSHWWVEDTP